MRMKQHLWRSKYLCGVKRNNNLTNGLSLLRHQTQSQTLLLLGVFELQENKFSAWLFWLYLPWCQFVRYWQEQCLHNNHSLLRGKTQERKLAASHLKTLTLASQWILSDTTHLSPFALTIVLQCRSYPLLAATDNRNSYDLPVSYAAQVLLVALVCFLTGVGLEACSDSLVSELSTIFYQQKYKQSK